MHQKFRYNFLLLFALLLSSCQGVEQNPYTDNEPLRLDLSLEKLTVLQLTDLHLTFGFDSNDLKTFRLIDALISETSPDLIVFTGDLTMSPTGPKHFKELGTRVDRHQIPWTFVFGNHENDFGPYEDYLKYLSDFEYLYYKNGPELDGSGFGNFKIETYYEQTPFYNLYFLDSHTEASGSLSYAWLTEAQVDWFDQLIREDSLVGTESSVFMHIPLQEYELYDENQFLDGEKGENISKQGVNTGFFNKMKEHGVAKAVFVGHDHLNNFSFLHEGILLAYGQASGYNGYGNTNKGGRLIEIAADKSITTTLLFDKDFNL